MTWAMLESLLLMCSGLDPPAYSNEDQQERCRFENSDLDSLASPRFKAQPPSNSLQRHTPTVSSHGGSLVGQGSWLHVDSEINTAVYQRKLVNEHPAEIIPSANACSLTWEPGVTCVTE